MRRRFEKRIYISLPDAGAREYMFRLHIGDTPHTLDDDNFKKLGELSDGMSGSDISVAVREALMNPVRMLRAAKFFRIDEDGFYNPCREYPPCPHCPIKTSQSKSSKKPSQCKKCGSYRMSLFDVPPEKLKEPPVSWHDFEEALKHTTASVAPSELKQFEDWTAEFGEAA
jgi:vacuolar protein-sorting-associated protein 4